MRAGNHAAGGVQAAGLAPHDKHAIMYTGAAAVRRLHLVQRHVQVTDEGIPVTTPIMGHLQRRVEWRVTGRDDPRNFRLGAGPLPGARSRCRRLRPASQASRREARCPGRVQESFVIDHERGQPGARTQGRAEMNGIQDAHIGRLGGTGQDPKALVQVDLVQHGGPSRDRVRRVPGPAPGMIRSRSTPS
jgi:hypothetical protein